MTEFMDIVVHYFRFLIEDFGYKIKQTITTSAHFGNSIVCFATSVTGINVVLDRGQVFVYTGPLTLPVEEWFDICDVIPYFASHIDKVYLFPEDVSDEASIVFQVDRLSSLIRMYCSPILAGDLSMAKQLREIQRTRAEKFKSEMKKRYPDSNV